MKVKVKAPFKKKGKLYAIGDKFEGSEEEIKKLVPYGYVVSGKDVSEPDNDKMVKGDKKKDK